MVLPEGKEMKKNIKKRKIILADDGISFDGNTLKNEPLGGAETAFAANARLAEQPAGEAPVGRPGFFLFVTVSELFCFLFV